jgi:hypothetical protein
MENKLPADIQNRFRLTFTQERYSNGQRIDIEKFCLDLVQWKVKYDELKKGRDHLRICYDAANKVIDKQDAEHLQLKERAEKMEAALSIVRDWKLPATGRFWDDGKKTRPLSYEAAYGSNGVRDYMKNIANDALACKGKEVELSCMVCGTKFMGPEPRMCCSGRDCGCMGLPIDPIICSEECYEKGIPPQKGDSGVIINSTIPSC